jgi:AcrR family transcriptional regulator
MDKKQMEILERTSQVFMRYGIKTVTMDDLSRELGVSKKTIYKYFEDKNALVNAMIKAKLHEDHAACIECNDGSENAIEALIKMSQFVMEHLSNVNPTVFYDLRKYYPEAWKLMESHKWDFILNNIRENMERGISEKLYRENLHVEIISRMYVASIETILNGEVFPWPDFKIDKTLLEVIRFQLKGMVNENGLTYIQQHFNNEINE